MRFCSATVVARKGDVVVSLAFRHRQTTLPPIRTLSDLAMTSTADDDGVFNFFEGGYAKTIKLSGSCRARHLSRMTVVMRCWKRGGSRGRYRLISDDGRKPRTPVLYLTDFRNENIVKPISAAGHATKVIFP